jgi:DNA polymerase III epsilon subunit-like protein
VGLTWATYDTNVIEVVEDWYILAFSATWLDSDETIVRSLPDYPLFKTDHKNDRLLVEELWGWLDQATHVVAHNGDSFDIKKSNSRFLIHGLAPPSPYKSVDTLKIARKHFKFTSNKLDALGQALGCGRKLKHSGKQLWIDCMAGDEAAFAQMAEYCKQDSDLLKAVYLKLRPWATTHPNLTFMTRQHDACPSCQSPNTTHRGWNYSRTGKRRRIQCQDCGAWSATGNLVKA